MKKYLQLALGIVTSIGGFLDAGNLATSVQAGAVFRFQLVWPLALATLLVIFLVEMSGRFAAVSRKALPDAIREHFGFTLWLVPFTVLTISHLLVLGTEIGGICFALHLVSGLPTPLWALPVAVLLWFFLWRSPFNTIENSTSLLGLLTLAFVVAALYHHPPVREVAAGLVPSLPQKEPLKESLDPREDSRFSLVYTGAILVASLPILFGLDPLKLTLFTMAVEAAVLPFVALPFLLLMNDRKLLREQANGWISNAVAVVVLLLSLVLMVVSIPLAVLGGGG